MSHPPPQATGCLRILIAGGGTGGHFFPALAIAETLVRLRSDSQVRFIGTPWGVEARLAPLHGWHLHRIWVRGWYRAGWRRQLLVMLMLPIALGQCLWLLLRWRPALVLGVGGYASAPALAAALLLRLPTAIQEQNASPGITNRLLGPWVKLAFVPTADLGDNFPRLQVTGTPVRDNITAIRRRKRQQDGSLRLLVLGGSQGAHLLNRTLSEAAPLLAAGLRKHQLKLEVLHQTGSADLALVQQCWAKAANDFLSARTTVFVQDMPQALLACHLVYSRAGASATAELCAAGRACVLTPITRSSGDHQRANANRLVQAGGALSLEEKNLSPQLLAETLLQLLKNTPQRNSMEARMAALHHHNAAEAIAQACIQLAGR